MGVNLTAQGWGKRRYAVLATNGAAQCVYGPFRHKWLAEGIQRQMSQQLAADAIAVILVEVVKPTWLELLKEYYIRSHARRAEVL